MSVIKKLAKNATRSTIGDFVDNIRVGWNNYSFLLYIGGASAILGGVFGLVGWASIVVTIVFFYYAGEFRKEVNAETHKWLARR
jgi:hypothetical protein